ncbi:MAG: hypothetical protein M3305_06090 [Actinomycetota bacterium]|nr:hypothetical protein [Actinomycetota bacterium]
MSFLSAATPCRSVGGNARQVLEPLPEQMRGHLDRGYDPESAREKRRSRGFILEISEKGGPTLLRTGKRCTDKGT